MLIWWHWLHMRIGIFLPVSSKPLNKVHFWSWGVGKSKINQGELLMNHYKKAFLHEQFHRFDVLCLRWNVVARSQQLTFTLWNNKLSQVLPVRIVISRTLGKLLDKQMIKFSLKVFTLITNLFSWWTTFKDERFSCNYSQFVLPFWQLSTS